MNPLPIVIRIPAQADYLDIVRAALYAIASKVGFSYEAIEDMKVAVTEACTNAIRHAYEERGGWIELSFLWDNHELRITIKDDGRGKEEIPTQHMTRSVLHQSPIADVTVGGLGIFLMEALMDEVHVRSENGTEVVLMKRMSRNEEMV
ncbi:anti-sigma B factor RsbW [Paenibacillus paeoniae]|uniref:Anti-sigma B factor RsbW n=1 Tax=Paenibacillus paeoniae TaxID=2292705 RepID=A0A371P7B5_9BACL|nr:anti-sigma B factor RsbW [Paenibacillus paeoniae]REK71356.1 anti-sigma B factor RsbW [Paenibacillus paeoniae]